MNSRSKRLVELAALAHNPPKNDEESSWASGDEGSDYEPSLESSESECEVEHPISKGQTPPNEKVLSWLIKNLDISELELSKISKNDGVRVQITSNHDTEVQNVNNDKTEVEKVNNDETGVENMRELENVPENGVQPNLDGFKKVNEAENRKESGLSLNGLEEEKKIENGTEEQNSDDLKKRQSILNSPHLIKNKYKKTRCKFCNSEVVSKHFSRHLKTHHKREHEVKEILETKDQKLKNDLIMLLRNSGNLDASLKGHIIPKRIIKSESATPDSHVICPDCKSYFKKQFLYRHRKTCFAKNPGDNSRQQEIMNSFIFTACQKKFGDVINKMYLKSEVLARMRGDEVAQEVLNDILILAWGDGLLKKTPQNRSKYHLSAKMRRCASLVIQMRKMRPEYTNMFSCLKPSAFDDVVEATKKISGFNPETRTYSSASTALQFGAYLKQIVSLANKLILCDRINIEENVDKNFTLDELNKFKSLVEEHWTTELASLAKKDLEKRAAKKVAILPLTGNIIKLKRFVDETREKVYNELLENSEPEMSSEKSQKTAFSKLAECTLISAVMHNRKRGGDLQYLELQDYVDQRNNLGLQTKAKEFVDSLNSTEKILVNNYVKIQTIGKGSRGVPVLIPKDEIKYFDLVKKIRIEKTGSWFKETNPYIFTFPKSIKWIDSTSVLRKYAIKCQIEQPHLMTSTRLRKHVATVTQLLDMKGNDIEQLCRFMGHTRDTHQSYYKLPDDVYQTAKISKLLLLLESGKASEYRNKNLDEIELNLENEFVEEDVVDDVQNENAEDDGVDEVQSGNAENNIQGDELNERAKNKLRTRFQRKRKRNEHSESCKSDDSDDNFAAKRVNSARKKSIRKRWNLKDKQLVIKAFKTNISKKKFPKKKEILSFIQKYNNQFGQQDYTRIRNLIVNEYTLK